MLQGPGAFWLVQGERIQKVRTLGQGRSLADGKVGQFCGLAQVVVAFEFEPGR